MFHSIASKFIATYAVLATAGIFAIGAIAHALAPEAEITLVAAAGACALTTGVALTMLARGERRSLRHLSGVVEEIRRGNLDARATLRPGGEAAELARALNEMAAAVQTDIRELKKLEQYRKEFLGNVSHELRTPIFSIQGYIESLQRGAAENPELHRKFLERALFNVMRLNTLVNDLLEISQMESGEMRMSFRYFDISAVIRQVAEEMEAPAAQKNLRISAEIPSGEMLVFGDKERIKEVLLNLVDNAIKYTDAGNITLSAAHNDGVATIAVRDTGTGIPPEHISRIFERFYRVDKDRSRQAGGTGLGLAIVKHILEKHHTRIIVESNIGKGSEFRFTLKS